MLNKYLFCLIVFFILLNISIESVSAEAEKMSVILDKQTLENGYTLQNNDFFIGIPARSFNNEKKIFFRKINSKKIDLPDNLNLISSVYKYKISTKKSSRLKNPIWLGLMYNSNSNYQKKFYYYNRTKKNWQPFKNISSKNENRINVVVHKAYTKVAIFEDPNALEEPIPSSNFTNFSDSLDAVSAISIDEQSGKILYEKNSSEVRSIASLTKVITALVFLETNTPMDKVITYNSANDREGAMLHVSNGETMTVQDIFYTMLVGSANNCALTLADSTDLSRDDFIQKMNDKAASLGLTNTQFVEPSGLDPANVSTASEYAILMQTALDRKEILDASTVQNYSFYTINTNNFHSINHTNLTLDWDSSITGGKTGYLDEALYCLILKIKNDDHEVITVLLGNPNSYDRFSETYELTQWSLNNYVW